MRRTKVIAIVLDPATTSLRFGKVKVGQETSAGKVIFVNKAGAALLKKQIWLRERFGGWKSHRRYVLIKEGDPRPLIVDDKGIKPADYDASMFESAITTTIATRFMSKGTDWKVIVIAMLGFIIIVEALIMYGLAR